MAKAVPSICVLLAVLLASSVAAQTLEVIPAGPGVRAVVLTLPLDDAVSLAWPEVAEDGRVAVQAVTVPALMGSGELERRLGAAGTVPPVMVVTGPLRPDEISGLVTQLAADRDVAELPPPSRPELIEGGAERRLAPPGSDAELRLRLPLPPRGDLRRPGAEVLVHLLPSLLERSQPRLSVHVEGDVAELSRPVEAERAEGTLARLRLDLSRLADGLEVSAGEVARIRDRMAVARAVRLGRHPHGAEELVRCWLAGGEPAVRQFLFGLGGVGPQRVLEAARGWLALHPGAALLLLPPRVLNPRFAAAPRTEELPDGLTVVILERPATPLECLVVRPVLTQDLEGGATAAVLARLAGALRQAAEPPPWAEVRRDPPRLELAAPPGQGATLLEALNHGLEVVAGDATAVQAGGGARERALGLMAAALGLASGGPLTPAALLRPDNLVLGAVVTDGEAAAEALRKLLAEGGPPAAAATASDLEAPTRTRVAVPGRTACLVVRLPGGAAGGPARLAAWLLVHRLAGSVEELSVEQLEPVVAGGHPALVAVWARSTLPELERTLRERWPSLTAPPGDEELEAARRELLGEESRRFSGPLGRAGLMAEVAAGCRRWMAPSQWQAGILALGRDDLEPILAGWSDWDGLLTTGAGPLPVSSLPLPRAPGGR